MISQLLSFGQAGDTALGLILNKVDTVLELKALTKQYATHTAVDSICLGLARGEFFSLVGPSGCGKTTTLRLIAGLETPTSGDIFLNGSSVSRIEAYRRNVNTVFQNYALFPHLSVERNVAFGLERRGTLSKEAIGRQVKEALALVQLSGKESRFPHQISGGERQRVALARSLVLQPEVLLLDEPLSALDPQLRKQMRIELKALQRRVGITFLFITHDQEEALSLSDRMGLMNAGRIEQIGSPKELYEAPHSKFVAEFMGEVNWVNGSGVRPEATNVSRENPPLEQSPNVRAIPGVIHSVTYLGHCIHLRTVLEDGAECVAQVGPGDCQFKPGERVYVWWNSCDALPAPLTA